GMYFFETKEKKLKFVELPEQRKFLFAQIEFREANAEQIKLEVEKKLHEMLSNAKSRPLVKLKLKGSLAKGLAEADIDSRQLGEKFREKAIVAIDCSFEEAGFKQKLQQLRDAQLGKKSIAAMGFDLLEKNLLETEFNNAFDVKRIFDLLAAGEMDKVVELLGEEKKG
ncbi:MAG: hypothetical protein Q8N60_01380, partial [Candidatus Diapherotrites archaeon]|nr:hypothetical protein [Candidatus Diapherotrites archaeon]